MWEAVQGLNAASAPGVDGFTGTFYVTCWSIINNDVVAAIQDFFKGADIPKSISSTTLVLIPKVQSPKKLTDLRPISLCTFASKIISIILNDRMAGVQPTGFLAKRKKSTSCL